MYSNIVGLQNCIMKLFYLGILIFVECTAAHNVYSSVLLKSCLSFFAGGFTERTACFNAIESISTMSVGYKNILTQ